MVVKRDQLSHLLNQLPILLLILLLIPLLTPVLILGIVIMDMDSTDPIPMEDFMDTEDIMDMVVTMAMD